MVQHHVSHYTSLHKNFSFICSITIWKQKKGSAGCKYFVKLIENLNLHCGEQNRKCINYFKKEEIELYYVQLCIFLFLNSLSFYFARYFFFRGGLYLDLM